MEERPNSHTPCNHPLCFQFPLESPFLQKKLDGIDINLYTGILISFCKHSQSLGKTTPNHPKPDIFGSFSFLYLFCLLGTQALWILLCNALLGLKKLYWNVCMLCFAGESRAELQGNGDASTAAATSASLAAFQPSLIILTTTSLTFLLTFIQALRLHWNNQLNTKSDKP